MGNWGVLIQQVGVYNIFFFDIYKCKRILQKETIFFPLKIATIWVFYQYKKEKGISVYIEHIVFNYSLLTFYAGWKVNFGGKVGGMAPN